MVQIEKEIIKEKKKMDRRTVDDNDNVNFIDGEDDDIIKIKNIISNEIGFYSFFFV
jgi:hypothetical protein